MTAKNRKGIRALWPDGAVDRALFILSLVLSAVLLAAAVCYAVSCISIYSSGSDSPFTREVVAEHLGRLLPISIIAVLLVIAADVLSLFTNEKKAKAIPIKNKILVGMTERKLSLSHISTEYKETITREAKLRKLLLIITASISSVITAVMLVFVLDPSRYSVEDANTDIAYSSVIVLIATIVILGGYYACSLLSDLSYKRVLNNAREELARQKSEGVAPTPCEDSPLPEGHTVLVVRLVILAVAVAFIILGIFNGGMADVLGKAVRICTECIGLG